MESVCLVKKHSYRPKNATSFPMETLGAFFVSEVTGYISSWINFALDNNRTGAEGNTTGLDKEGDFIIMGDIFHEEDEVRTDTLTIHKDDFIKMLLRWEELYKQQPDEIFITQDDQGKISMVGKFNDGREI